MNATARRSHTPASPGCNHILFPLLVFALLLVPRSSPGQEPARPDAPPGEQAAAQPAGGEGTAARAAKFLLGGAAGLGIHEGGHLLVDAVFGVRPTVKKVDFGGIPFFAITHPAGLPPRREFTIASAGFWMQHLSSEIILTRTPDLGRARAPVQKGILAFNVLASVAYGAAACAKAGPFERDTRSMAETLRVDEAWVGGMVLVPAGLDAWRYFHPESRWAKWASRAAKIGIVLLVLRS